MFQDQFVPKVRSGAKTHTIRLNARCSPGDNLSLRRWTGKPYRSKHEIIREVVCKSVEGIWINSYRQTVEVRSRRLDDGEVELLAKSDGFVDAKAMYIWFCKTHSSDFYGDLVRW